MSPVARALNKIQALTMSKQNPLDERFSQPLSPAANEFLAAAVAEFGQKTQAWLRDWRVNDLAEYALNDQTGKFYVKLQDGAVWVAEAQILGSFNEADQTWQWAWGNTECAEIWQRDSRQVQAAGQQLGIWYLHELPVLPLPGTEFIGFLGAIGLKASESAAIFEAPNGSVVVFILLKNLQWTTAEEYAAGAATATARHGAELTEGIRQIKTGREDLIVQWNRLFAESEVYVISLQADDPDQWLVLGEGDEKNMIAVFTDQAGLEAAVAGRGNVLFPQAINGRVLLEKARDTGRGLVLNPTDDTASVPFPPEAMAQFLAMLG